MNLILGTYGMMEKGSRPMMVGLPSGPSQLLGVLHLLLGLATWVAFLWLLVGLARWVWKKGDRVK